MRIDASDLRMLESVFDHAASGFDCQATPPVSGCDRVAEFDHSFLVYQSLKSSEANQRLIRFVHKQVGPPTQNFGMRFQMLIAGLHGFLRSIKSKPISRKLHIQKRTEFLLVVEDCFEVLELAGK